MKRVAIIWTEVCQHSAIVDMPDDFDEKEALERALEQTDTFDAVTERTIDGVEVTE